MVMTKLIISFKVFHLKPNILIQEDLEAEKIACIFYTINLWQKIWLNIANGWSKLLLLILYFREIFIIYNLKVNQYISFLFFLFFEYLC